MERAFRHELKHRLTQAEADALARRLRLVLPRDPNSGERGYRVTSLYFDDPYDRALTEKLEGIGRREKLRLRRYGDDFERIRLERKSKVADLGTKERVELTREQARAVIAGDPDVLLGSEKVANAAVMNKLKSYGSVERVWGADRYATQMAVYEYGAKNGLWDKSDTAVIASATGFADALSASDLYTALGSNSVSISFSNTEVSTALCTSRFIAVSV